MPSDIGEDAWLGPVWADEDQEPPSLPSRTSTCSIAPDWLAEANAANSMTVGMVALAAFNTTIVFEDGDAG